MSSELIKPLSDRVVFKKIELEQVTKSGIILSEPETLQEIQYGEVVAIGRGKIVDGTLHTIPMECAVGDTIAYKPHIPTPIKIQGEQYFLCRESDTLAIV